MNEEKNYRRRRRFVDKVIQGQLLWWLIIIESLLFTIGMFVIYTDLQGVITENIFRVHQQGSTGRPVLLKELLIIFPWIIAANLLLVIAVDRHWKKIVRTIIMQLQDVLYRIKRLDLRIFPVQQSDHEVLQSARQWLDKERDRYTSLQNRMKDIPETIDQTDAKSIYQIRETLKSMSRVLPNV